VPTSAGKQQAASAEKVPRRAEWLNGFCYDWLLRGCKRTFSPFHGGPIRCSKDLAAKEGIFVGITAGGTLAGALKIAAEAVKGANILCMLPDTGERYLSTPLFADVSADMNEEELKISRSTPGAQLKP
jgi:hypothetical protein